jgi:RNA recognition motif-containing protein
MAIKLFVGNLSYDVTEEQLNTLFSEAGEVTSAKIITDRQTGQPRGFGFVEMETKLEGQKAISMLNGRNVEGRPLAVNEAKPQQRGGFGGGGGGGGRGGYR